MFKAEDALLYYWASLVRSYNRLVMVECGEWYEKDFGSELDLYYSFFVKCYHLKDWLMKLAEKDKKKNIRERVEKSTELRACRNVCNSTKHFLLDHKEVDANAQLANLSGLGEGISLFREYSSLGHLRGDRRCYEIRIETVGKRWTAIELATACMEQWAELIQGNWDVTLPNFRRS